LKNKVLLDTNILIAASVYFAGSEVYDYRIQHDFFDKAMQLIGLVKKYLAKRIGIITATIENEVHLVFNKAILDTVKKYTKTVGRSDAFEIMSTIADSCESRLNELMLFLLREPIDPLQKSVWFVAITEMFEKLKERAEEIDPQDIAYRRAGTQSSKRLVRTAYEVFLEQENQRFAQLKRLLDSRKEPDKIDKEILAEAAYLNCFYKQTEGEITMFLATTDLTLSPIPYTIESRIVTDEIQKRLSVVCDWPDRIAKKLG